MGLSQPALMKLLREILDELADQDRRIAQLEAVIEQGIRFMGETTVFKPTTVCDACGRENDHSPQCPCYRKAPDARD